MEKATRAFLKKDIIKDVIETCAVKGLMIKSTTSDEN